MLRTNASESRFPFSLARFAALGVGLACTTGLGACSGSVNSVTSPASTDSGSDDAQPVGSINVEFRLPSGTASMASYRLTGPNGFSYASMLDFQGSQAVGFFLGSIPVGAGYELSFTASDADGGESCAGSTTFAVNADKTTTVSLDATCTGGPYVPIGFGSIDAWVAVPDTETLASASFSLAGPAGIEANNQALMGPFAAGGIHFGLQNLPAGPGQVLSISAQTTTGLKCVQSTAIDIAVNATAEAKLSLVCR
jgi:hypothetical protein